MRSTTIQLGSLGAILLATTLAAAPVGCSSGMETSDGTASDGTASEALASVKYDGETLLRGLFLGKGPVAARIPELWANAAVTRGADMTTEQMIAQIEGAATELRSRGIDASQLDELAARLARGDVSRSELRDASVRSTAESDAQADRVIARLGASDATFFARFAAEVQSGDHLRVQAALDDGAKRLFEATTADSGARRKKAGDGTTGNCVYVALNVAVAFEAVAVVLAVFFLERPEVSLVAEGGGGLKRSELVNTITLRFAQQ